MVSTKLLVDTRRRWESSDGAGGSAPMGGRGEAPDIEETRASSVSVVAKRHDTNANLLFKWKRV